MDNGREIVLIAHNLRSCHNVGSLFRTAEGLGISKIYLTGYTPYPLSLHDKRLPHIAAKNQRQIDKTALGADKNISWEFRADIYPVFEHLKKQAFHLVALEQTTYSVDISKWAVPAKTALIVGRETEGIESEIIQMCSTAVVIPMLGKKESFNVVQAAAMALYHCRFYKL
jgi:23S rRNA (guanosine2251-2'-O)-methyltransferase